MNYSPSYLKDDYGIATLSTLAAQEFQESTSGWLGEDDSILPMAAWQIEQAKKGRYVSSFTEAVQDPERRANLSAGGWFIDPASDSGMYARSAFILAVAARILGNEGLIGAAEDSYNEAGGWDFWGISDKNIRPIAVATAETISAAASFQGEEGLRKVRGIVDRLLSMSTSDATESIQKARAEVTPRGIVAGTIDKSAEDAGDIATILREGGQDIYYLISGKEPPGKDPPPRWKVWLTRGAIALGVGGVLLYVGRPYVELAREGLDRFDKDEDEEE